MENLLDLLVPVYGKDPQSTFENLNHIISNLPDNVGMIIAYKNSDDNNLNYDNLNSLANDNVKVFKAGSEVKKTAKLKIALENSKAHYIMPMDSHHSIDVNKIKNAVKEISKFKEKKVNIIWQKFKAYNVDTNKFERFGPPRWFATAGSQIIQRDLIDVSKIEYDIIFADDSTFGLNAMLNENIKFRRMKTRFYFRNRGVSISGTFSKSEKADLVKVSKDTRILFNDILDKSFEIYKENPNHQFSKEFAISFYFIFKYSYYRFYFPQKEESTWKNSKIENLNFLNEFIINGDKEEKIIFILMMRKKAYKLSYDTFRWYRQLRNLNENDVIKFYKK